MKQTICIISLFLCALPACAFASESRRNSPPTLDMFIDQTKPADSDVITLFSLIVPTNPAQENTRLIEDAEQFELLVKRMIDRVVASDREAIAELIKQLYRAAIRQSPEVNALAHQKAAAVMEHFRDRMVEYTTLAQQPAIVPPPVIRVVNPPQAPELRVPLPAPQSRPSDMIPERVIQCSRWHRFFVQYRYFIYAGIASAVILASYGLVELALYVKNKPKKRIRRRKSTPVQPPKKASLL